MPNRIFRILVVALICISVTPALSESLPPVVFVPGHQGSTLETNQDQLWPPFSNITDGGPSQVKTRLDKLNLYRGHSGIVPYQVYQDIPLRFRIAGKTFEVDFGSYRSFLKFLKTELGYQPGDILEFPYDWRLSIEENSALLQQKIKEFSSGHAGQDVVVIAHSMGGLVTRHALKSDSDLPIKSIIQMGTPVAGLAKPAALSYGGELFKYSTILIDKEILREIVLSFPSSYELQSDVSLILNNRNLNANLEGSWKALFPAVYNTAPARLIKLKKDLRRAVRVKTACRSALPRDITDVRIVSTKWDTVRAIDVNNNRLSFKFAKGDGTVLRTSALYPNDNQSYQRCIVNNKHAYIPADREAQNRVAWELYEAAGKPVPKKFGTQKPHGPLLDLKSLNLSGQIKDNTVVIEFSVEKNQLGGDVAFLGNGFKVQAGWRDEEADGELRYEENSHHYTGKIHFKSDFNDEAFWVSVHDKNGNEVLKVYSKVDLPVSDTAGTT